MAVPISKSSQIFEYGTNSEIKLSINSQQTNIMKMYMDLISIWFFLCSATGIWDMILFL